VLMVASKDVPSTEQNEVSKKHNRAKQVIAVGAPPPNPAFR
jgi:hypothetical protein